MEQMNAEKILVTALHMKVEGKRSKSRQRKRWIDNAKEDLTKLGSSI